jgi:hypothetical protein
MMNQQFLEHVPLLDLFGKRAALTLFGLSVGEQSKFAQHNSANVVELTQKNYMMPLMRFESINDVGAWTYGPPHPATAFPTTSAHFPTITTTTATTIPPSAGHGTS